MLYDAVPTRRVSKIKLEAIRFDLMLISLGFVLAIDMAGLLVPFPNAFGSAGSIGLLVILNCLTTVMLMLIITRRIINPPMMLTVNPLPEIDDPESDIADLGVHIQQKRQNLNRRAFYTMDLLLIILYVVRTVETAKIVSRFHMDHLDFAAPIPALFFSILSYLCSAFMRWYTPIEVPSR